MLITVRFFAILRELMGEDMRQVDVPEGTTVGGLFEMLTAPLNLPALRAPILFAVNEDYAKGDHALQAGDEVVFIPPVSGGIDLHRPRQDALPFVDISEDTISLEALIARVESHGHGAIVTFQGTVRDHAEGRRVSSLTYEAYIPMAKAQMAAVAAEIGARFGVTAVAMVHRVGDLSLGDIAVAIAAASPHRAEAFEACRYAIDRVKETVPIWKKEFYDDAEPLWK